MQWIFQLNENNVKNCSVRIYNETEVVQNNAENSPLVNYNETDVTQNTAENWPVLNYNEIFSWTKITSNFAFYGDSENLWRSE